MSLRDKLRSHVPVLFLALAGPLSGCGKSASTVAPATPGPTPSVLTPAAADDIARQLGAALARDFGIRRGNIGRFARAAMRSRDRSPVRTETDTTSGHLSFFLTVTFFDAKGQEQPTYDPLTTVRMRLERRVRGYQSGPHMGVKMGSWALLDIEGIDANRDRTTMNGASNDTLNAHFVAAFDAGERYFHLEARGILDHVVQLKPHEANPYPLSGTLTYEVDADQLDVSDQGRIEATYRARAKVTFNGTAYPEIEFEEGWTYRVDLNSGAIERL